MTSATAMLRTTCSGDATESAAAVAWSVGCSDDDDVTLSDVYDLQTDSSKEFSCVGFELQYESDDMTLGHNSTTLMTILTKYLDTFSLCHI